jgi:hypothetical protein
VSWFVLDEVLEGCETQMVLGAKMTVALASMRSSPLRLDRMKQ